MGTWETWGSVSAIVLASEGDRLSKARSNCGSAGTDCLSYSCCRSRCRCAPFDSNHLKYVRVRTKNQLCVYTRFSFIYVAIQREGVKKFSKK